MKVAIVGDLRVQKVVRFMRLGYHLAEATALFHSKKLVEQYKEFHQLGHFIMLDNGAAEASHVHKDGSVTHMGTPPLFEMVVRLAGKIGADEVILPDRKKDAEWTFDHTVSCSELLPPVMRAIVPQGKDEAEWFDCYQAFRDKIEFNTVCITKDYDRQKLLRLLAGEDISEYHHVHLLGISGPDVEGELRGLVHEFPWIRGIDSAIAIAYAQRWYHIGNKEVERPSYIWGSNFPTSTARNNIRLLLEWSKYDPYPD